MLNRVQTLLVGKASGAVNTGTTLATITAGDIFVINQGGTVLTEATADAAAKAGEPIYIVQGTAAGKFRKSAIIQGPKSVQHYTKVEYAAPTERIITIADAQLAAETTYVIRIVYKTAQRLLPNRQDREVIVHTTPDSAAFVEADEVAKIVGKINASKFSGSLVTAASDGADGFTITGKVVPTESIDKYEQVDFDVFLEGFAAGVEVTETQEAFRGQGTPILVREMEHTTLGNRGVTNLRQFPIPTITYYSQLSGVTGYNLIHIAHFDKHTGDLQFQMESPVLTSIACSTDGADAQYDALVTILDAYISGTYVAAP